MINKLVKYFVRITFPILIISYTNVRLLWLISHKGNEPLQNYPQDHHRVWNNFRMTFQLLISAPRVHLARHCLHLHPLQPPAHLPDHSRHGQLQHHHRLQKLWGPCQQRLGLLHRQYYPHNHWYDGKVRKLYNVRQFIFPADFLKVCNSSINFLLYVMFAPKFRFKVRTAFTDMVKSFTPGSDYIFSTNI